MAPLRFAKQLLSEMSQDKVGQLSAAFAYIALFSIGPLLLVVVSLLGFIFGERAVEGSLFSQLSDLVGPDTAQTLQDAMVQTYQSGHGALALIVGTVGLLWGATGISGQLQNSFNAIFKVVADPKGGVTRTVYVKVKNVALVIFGGLAVAASVIASTVIIGLGDKVQERLGIPAMTLELLNNFTSLLVFMTILYLIYKVLPDVIIPKKIILAAAFVVALLFMIGKIILGVIIGNNATASAYGAAASLVTLLLWIYYSGQLLLLGAEGIKLYGTHHSLSYGPKKFSLKRTTVSVDSPDFSGKLVQAFIRGFRKKRQ